MVWSPTREGVRGRSGKPAPTRGEEDQVCCKDVKLIGESILLCIVDAKVDRRKWAMHGVNYKTELFGEYHHLL